jgi:hypothetical protein
MFTTTRVDSIREGSTIREKRKQKRTFVREHSIHGRNEKENDFGQKKRMQLIDCSHILHCAAKDMKNHTGQENCKLPTRLHAAAYFALSSRRQTFP